eukprot:787481-Alexandrium_andersonii.AAC.1
MSASLVGSEMCIRDRRISRRRRSRPPPDSPAQTSTQLQARTADKPGPVSYTHLTLPTICSV